MRWFQAKKQARVRLGRQLDGGIYPQGSKTIVAVHLGPAVGTLPIDMGTFRLQEISPLTNDMSGMRAEARWPSYKTRRLHYIQQARHGNMNVLVKEQQHYKFKRC
jgi:hypothetical protein